MSVGLQLRYMITLILSKLQIDVVFIHYKVVKL